MLIIYVYVHSTFGEQGKETPTLKRICEGEHGKKVEDLVAYR